MGFGSSTSCSISLNTVLTEDQRTLYQDSEVIRGLLGEARTIAVVGLSTESTKPSNMVAAYLQVHGYRVIPVHPKAAFILGEKVFRSLADVDVPIDVVDVFRPATEVGGIVQQAIGIGAKAIWMQLRIVNLDAALEARNAGLSVVVDKCIKMEHGRFSGALHWAGMNTEIVSARRRTWR